MKHFLLLSLALALSLPAAAAPPPPNVDELVLAAGTPAPSFALAQVEPAAPAPAPAPSVLGEFAKQFLTPTGIASLVVTVFGLVSGALGLSGLRKRQIAIVTEHAFRGVEDFAATTENVVDDKVALGLKIADEWMRAQGWRPLKPDEQAVVKLGFSSLNGSSKVSEKVAANGQVGATKDLTSPETRAELDAIARGNPRSA